MSRCSYDTGMGGSASAGLSAGDEFLDHSPFDKMCFGGIVVFALNFTTSMILSPLK
jgi:hypothetical protein